jgi:ADP-ribose pyrophosphatase YjhB (NUDIX family)
MIVTMFMIASALIQRQGSICLIEQRGPDDAAAAWMLPGGRVEDGEGVLAALAREVAEEAGLIVTGTAHLAFLVDLTTKAGTYTAMTFRCEATGELRPADPDGFVIGADFVPVDEALRRLALVEWYDVVPLTRYLRDDALPGATYRFGLT